jgi:(E)-4-hydroxy-3-methylbut-2-enyl-diphosphate synthase
MTKTDTRDVRATLRRISSLSRAGCEIVRLAVPDLEAAEALTAICRRSPLPVIADIHFDHRLALRSVAAGVAGLRINPGNIGSSLKVREVIAACRGERIPVRVGVNAGSLEKALLARRGGPTARALAESALQEVRLIEKEGYREIKISVKAFDIPTTIAAYRELSARVDYPFHIGITEAGPFLPGTVRSAIGIGALLLEGMGDTVRVSLSAPEEEEARVGKLILQSLGLRSFGPVLVSCPTCGRCRVDLLPLVKQVEAALSSTRFRSLSGVTVAVMGCAVNGPGEAREADLGIAAGRNSALLFRRGQAIRTVPARRIVSALLSELARLPPRE